ncbi:MAG: hypothetical protein HZA20_11085 [Nitrospirae bacterium]|nr:hypothetical protein [Nitrospirota bacterium]
MQRYNTGEAAKFNIVLSIIPAFFNRNTLRQPNRHYARHIARTLPGRRIKRFTLEMQGMSSLVNIGESEFIALAEKEQCRACLSERSNAVSPHYRKYTIHADKFMIENVYPTWRTNKDKTKYIGAYETPPTEAFPITYQELASCPDLFSEIQFDAKKDYLGTTNIIVFYCMSCGVRVVKDGNHRLLQCAVQCSAPEITVFEVASNDWQRCEVDMKNFCKCISNRVRNGL